MVQSQIDMLSGAKGCVAIVQKFSGNLLRVEACRRRGGQGLRELRVLDREEAGGQLRELEDGGGDFGRARGGGARGEGQQCSSAALHCIEQG